MEKTITTTLNIDEFKALIAEALEECGEWADPNVNIELSNDFMDQQQAAKFLHITLPTIIRWKKENKIPYYQEGRKVLFKKSELLKVLQKNESLLKWMIKRLEAGEVKYQLNLTLWILKTNNPWPGRNHKCQQKNKTQRKYPQLVSRCVEKQIKLELVSCRYSNKKRIP